MADALTVDALMANVILAEFPDDAARLLEMAADDETAALLATKAPDARLAVIRRLTPDRSARVVARLPAHEMRETLSSLNPSYVSALLARLDPEERDRCLATLDERLAAELRDMAKYPAETAGALMDPRVTTFRPDASVRDVTKRLRTFRNRRVQDVFLVDPEGVLAGSLTIEKIVLSDPGSRLDALLDGELVSVQVVASREEVIQTFEERRIASLPVVDFDGRLVGVLRQREPIRAANERATASAVTMVGASEQERALSSPLFAVKKRLPWLQINLLTAFLAASVVGLFEETIATVTALAVLLPVVAGQSGNTGAQALAVTMRGLALREVRTRHWLRVVTKEVLAGAGNGVAVALTTSAAVWFWSDSSGLALVIGVSMVISMTLAGLSGAAIPMILTALRQDPAQSSSIVLTTVTDVAGFFSFLGIATLLSSML
jgi:magnesium transporter